MKFLIIIVIAVVLLIPINAYAIDYRDSSGYTPSWAMGQGYHYVLNECNYLIGDTSRDGNWCNDWVAYVLDQGVDNFPESTKSSSSSTSTSNLSERVCTENKICVFPGEFLKYKNWDTYDNFEEIAIMEFKEKVNEDNIKFFADGFGSKPLTYNLNLKTGMETHSQYDTNRPFNFIEPIPMKMGQNVYRIIGDFYESTIAGEQTANLKEMGFMDMERTFMAAQVDYGGGDIGILGYDKETGVLVTQIEKYHLDGKEYTAGIVLLDTNIFSVPTKIVPVKETSIPEIEFQFTEESDIEEEFMDIPDVNEPEITTTQPEKQEVKIETTSTQDEESFGESGLNAITTILMVFMIIGFPILLIVLIVLKIIKRLPQGMFKKSMIVVVILFLVLIILGFTFGSLD